jgi:hypothetical protein
MADVDEMSVLFAEDAICSFGPGFGGDWVGRDVIRSRYAEFIARRTVPRFAMLHLATNPWIEIDDRDHARGHWYFTVVKAGANIETSHATMAGRYDDRYVRRGGQWLIQHSAVELIASG